MNIKPNMIDTIPIMIFAAEKFISIDAIPKNNKLTPIKIDTNAYRYHCEMSGNTL